MRRGDTRRFSDQEALARAINLRLAGFSPTSLSLVFGCHRSSLEYQFQIYGIQGPTGMAPIKHVTAFVVSHYRATGIEYEIDHGIRYSVGKTYQEYLAESKEHDLVIRIQHGPR